MTHIKVFTEKVIVSDDGLIVNYDKKSVEPPQCKETGYQDFIEKLADNIWQMTEDLKWKNELRLRKKESFLFHIGIYQFIAKYHSEINCASLYDNSEKDRIYFNLDTMDGLKKRLKEYVKGCDSKNILFDDDSFIEVMKNAAAYDNLVEQQQEWFNGLDNPEDYMGPLRSVVDLDDLFPTKSELTALKQLGYTFIDYEQLLEEMPNAVTVTVEGKTYTLWKHIKGYEISYISPNGVSAAATPETKRKISGAIHLLIWMRTVKQNDESK